MGLEKLTYKDIEKVITDKGMTFFKGTYNLNIVGIRSKNRVVNNWDDYLFVLSQDVDGCDFQMMFNQFTTDPGIYYMQKKLLNPKGCGILAGGQYRGLWTLDMHQGKYLAFCQRNNAKVKVYRDRNMNNYMDMDPHTLEEGYFGCNLHHGYDSAAVGPNSAMCQVLRYKKDLAKMLRLAGLQKDHGFGEKYTYTLLEEGKDL